MLCQRKPKASSPSSMNKTTFIYALVDRELGAVHYVGKADNPRERLRQHRLRSQYNFRFHDWVRRARPKLVILEECSVENWPSREQFWISYWKEKQAGYLLNKSKGGESSYSVGRRARSLEGQTFGRYKVIRRDIRKGKEARWLCQCSCGSPIRSISAYDLRSGRSKSCGCNVKTLSARRALLR